jgi:hypothetical protein
MAVGAVSMKRRLDWPERMDEALRAAGTFSERYHCAIFVADVVRAMTDEDPLPVRDETIAAAYARMRRDGFETLRAALAARVGSEVPLAFAQRGDVILRVVDDLETLGICCGQISAFISDDGEGLVFEQTLEQDAAYKVGE